VVFMVLCFFTAKDSTNFRLKNGPSLELLLY
jgi:hypothetical protein